MKTQNKLLPEFLTPYEIACILKISYDKSLDFLKYSGITFVKIGRQYRVLATDFYDFIHKNPIIDIDNT